MFKWFKSGSPWIWLSGGMVSISLVAVLGVLLLIGWKGLSYFWPAPVYQFEVVSPDGARQNIIGQIYERKQVSRTQLADAGHDVSGLPQEMERILVKTGNRDLQNHDFTYILAPLIVSRTTPMGMVAIERGQGGEFYGQLLNVIIEGKSFPEESEALSAFVQLGKNVQGKIEALQSTLASLNHRLVKLETGHGAERNKVLIQIREVDVELAALRDELDTSLLVVKTAAGKEVSVPLGNVVNAWLPNDMVLGKKLTHWVTQIASFVSSDPREANTEGGVFPAIFGTVFLVILMSMMVTPLGVVAAIYLHEYAKKNVFTRIIRIAVVNLAGVPSIVYGVFGLGFLVYMVGGNIDRLFFSDSLPNPTFGTPGVLWSALTLALLTLPVVIVATEEGLTRIPASVRHGSLALGATKAETLWRVVLPMASPAIMTGLILAIARAAGEVAPLMLVGVVKVAPDLPVDQIFPYVHLDRKFMHLGYHIYDVGFQSPNVEASRPLVYATSFLLVTVIVALNLSAIAIRNHLREKYRTLEQ
ncbi:phosphate ABC transporter permease PstA [Parasalinivibrio latis]|uniref:phosphate ABC transporter permease PstA n=1 Tax=Parasalinivibrio latis TaxID=2952610 RepID=UPI0030E3FACA